MKLAVTGPSGHIGRRLTELLLNDGSHEVILLARTPEKLSNEVSRGATVAKGVLDDAEFIKSATKGVEAMFWMIPTDIHADDNRAHYRIFAHSAVEAVKANKIKHIVLLSSIGAHLKDGVGPINGSTEAEKMLREVVPSLTILRPAFFMENFMMSLQSIATANSIFMPASGTTTTPMIATADIAEQAYKALTGSPPSGVNVVPIRGPKDYSFDEAAGVIGEHLGRKVTFVKTTPEQTREALIGIGASEHMANQFIEMYNAMETGRLKFEIPEEKVKPTKTSLEAFVDTTMAPAMKTL